jgi:hypothetical protein
MLLDKTAHRFDRIRFPIPADRLRPAAQASTVSRPLGGLRSDKKLHVFSSRPACCARWPAINSGRGDGKDELPVAPRVPRNDSFPLRVVPSNGARFSLNSWHQFSTFHCEYGIRRHSNQRLTPVLVASYPNLAFKLILQAPEYSLPTTLETI